MPHHVSANQLVLWPHHELTDARTATGIRHRPGTAEAPGDATERSHVPGGQDQRKLTTVGTTSALTRAHGRKGRSRAARRRVSDIGGALRAEIGHSCP
jgi:hypothetical protein